MFFGTTVIFHKRSDNKRFGKLDELTEIINKLMPEKRQALLKIVMELKDLPLKQLNPMIKPIKIFVLIGITGCFGRARKYTYIGSTELFQH